MSAASLCQWRQQSHRADIGISEQAKAAACSLFRHGHTEKHSEKRFGFGGDDAEAKMHDRDGADNDDRRHREAFEEVPCERGGEKGKRL